MPLRQDELTFIHGNNFYFLTLDFSFMPPSCLQLQIKIPNSKILTYFIIKISFVHLCPEFSKNY